MKLAQFIEAETEQLLENWEEISLEIAPRGHARLMLESISQGLAAFPGSDGTCMDQFGQGPSMLQVIQELRSLRSRVTKAWGEERRGFTAKDIDELVEFNETIDHLIANSLSAFSVRKDRETDLIETMLKAFSDPPAIVDRGGRHMVIDAAIADLVNMPQRDAAVKTPLELVLDLATELVGAITTTVTTGQAQHRAFHHNVPFDFDCQFIPVFNGHNEVEAVVKTSRDATERKQTDYQVWRSANFDALTGLPNRRLFIDRLEQTLLEAEREGSSFALLFIGVDCFSRFRDQLGNQGVDRLLAQVVERISTKVRAMDTVARVGKEEFSLILKGAGRDGAGEAAKALLAALEQPFDAGCQALPILPSIGLTVFPDAGRSVDELIRNADQAMCAAREPKSRQIQRHEPWLSSGLQPT
ncbi:sensor domain-containing diguanylate cyclase [Marinobacter vulgaris]|nr:sensor domain-containing diguanylate cyclase [Marinobacter vulgaris]